MIGLRQERPQYLFCDAASQFSEGALGNSFADCASDHLKYFVMISGDTNIRVLQNVRKQFSFPVVEYFFILQQGLGEILERLE
jgi:hypothetical protein